MPFYSLVYTVRSVSTFKCVMDVKGEADRALLHTQGVSGTPQGLLPNTFQQNYRNCTGLVHLPAM